MKRVFVFLDRDGTLIYDDKYYLGKQRNWRSLIRFMPDVVAGIRALRRIKGVGIHMMTNQIGISIKNFPLLTLERAHEVCREIMNRMRKRGARLDDYILCDHVSPTYVKKHPRFRFERKLVCNCSCVKPNSGMINDLLKKSGSEKSKAKIYVVGDRASDVRTGIKAGGFGILIPFTNEPGEIERFTRIKSRKKYLAKDFLDAAKFIVKN